MKLRSMKLSILAILTLPAVASADESDDASRTFRRKCQGCHTVPDPREKLDVAWLDQVHRTA